MNHCVLMFRPETWERIKGHGLIGISTNQHRRIEAISVGDKFMAYVSRSRLLDGRASSRAPDAWT